MAESKKIKLNVLFVCTGNTCRSPMAEFAFKQYLREKKRAGDFSVSSAGIRVVSGDVMNPSAAEALKFFNIKFTAKKARPLTLGMGMDADLVVTMTDAQADELEDSGFDNVVSCSQFGGGIPDPFGLSMPTYIETCMRIRDCFDGLFEYCVKLLNEKRGDNDGTAAPKP